MSRRIRKDDQVMLMVGDEKGKKGRVLRVFDETGRALVEGINLVRKASRKTPQNPRGGFVQKEAPVALAKLQYVCGKCGKPTRLGVKVLHEEAGKKKRITMRYCKKCQAEIGG